MRSKAEIRLQNGCLCRGGAIADFAVFGLAIGDNREDASGEADQENPEIESNRSYIG
jgi:hypothetical protein